MAFVRKIAQRIPKSSHRFKREDFSAMPLSGRSSVVVERSPEFFRRLSGRALLIKTIVN